MTATPTNPPANASKMPALLDRDHSILGFNERVLDWAYRRVSLLERLRYLCIVSSNLDEFFEVRAEPHLAASRLAESTAWRTCAVDQFERLAATLPRALVAQAIRAVQRTPCCPRFDKPGHSHRGARRAQSSGSARWVKQCFGREVTSPADSRVGLEPFAPVFRRWPTSRCGLHRAPGRQGRVWAGR